MDGETLGAMDDAGLRQLFDQLDAQQLGYLVREDLEAMFDPAQTGTEALDALMKQLDRDGDGKVGLDRELPV